MNLIETISGKLNISKSEVRRKLSEGAIDLNKETIRDNIELSTGKFTIKYGKHKFIEVLVPIETSQGNYTKYEKYHNGRIKYSLTNFPSEHLVFLTLPVIIGNGNRYDKFEQFVKDNCN